MRTALIAITVTCAASICYASPPGTPSPDSVLDLTAGPPYPAGVVLPILVEWESTYPTLSKRIGEAGRVEFRYVVGVDGELTDIEPLSLTPYYRLNDAATRGALSRHYRPATLDGKPIAVRIKGVLNFAFVGPAPSQSKPDSALLNETTDLASSCRYGSHRIAVDACTTLLASGLPKTQVADALFLRARAYEALGLHDKAKTDFDSLVALVPTNARVFRARGLINEELGQYQDALDDDDKAISLNEHYATAYLDRGFIYDRLGQHDRAAKEIADALEQRPNCNGRLDDLRYDSAACESVETFPSMRDHAIDALDYCDNAVVLDSWCARAQITRAIGRLRLGDDVGARKNADAELVKNPNSAWGLYLRGILERKTGDISAASSDFLAARVMDPEIATKLTIFDVAPAISVPPTK